MLSDNTKELFYFVDNIGKYFKKEVGHNCLVKIESLDWLKQRKHVISELSAELDAWRKQNSH